MTTYSEHEHEFTFAKKERRERKRWGKGEGRKGKGEEKAAPWLLGGGDGDGRPDARCSAARPHPVSYGRNDVGPTVYLGPPSYVIATVVYFCESFE